VHRGFFSEQQLLRGVDRIRHLPALIVQGRYDVVCPPATAHALHQAWPESQLKIVEDAGHAALEPGTVAALVAATEQFKNQRTFKSAL
jgi:proline iminopeptidase